MSFKTSLNAKAKKNVEIIAQIEKELHRGRSPVARVGEAFASYFGSLYFIVAHLAFMSAWIMWNTELIPGVQVFDGYPFGLLQFVMGAEFLLLTTFVLMNQKHEMRRTEQWSHLVLQLIMLTEQEVTKNMQMVHLICKHLGVDEPNQDREVQEMSQQTEVKAIVEEIGKVRDSETFAASTADRLVEEALIDDVPSKGTVASNVHEGRE